MKRRIAIIAIAILAITASLAAYYGGNGHTDAPKYTTALAVRSDVVESVEATGTLGAVTTVQVGSQVSGTIKSLHADFNAIVKKGQVVARLDPSLLQAQTDQAQASVARLEADVERAHVSLDDAVIKRDRARQLFSRGLVPAVEVETAEVTARQAQASVNAAQAQVTPSPA
jgi:HlyD family secretion protein